MGGVFASTHATQLLNVFVSNFPAKQNVTVTNFPTKTHLGQDIASLVTLACRASTGGTAASCIRTFSDGTSTSFVVPAGSVLVVMDVFWAMTTNIPPGGRIAFSIFLSPSSTGEVFDDFGTIDQAGLVTNSQHLTAGFVVSPAATMIFQCGMSCTAILYGYLVGTA